MTDDNLAKYALVDLGFQHRANALCNLNDVLHLATQMDIDIVDIIKSKIRTGKY